MPFQSEKQRRYLWSQKPEVARQLAYRNTGGPLAPAPSGAPGAATAPIQEYLAGTGTAPQLSYAPGEAGADQQSRINYQRDLRQLQEGGVDNAEQYVYQDWVTPHESDRPDDTWDNWNDVQRQRFLETGTSGHLISKSADMDGKRGVMAMTPEEFEARMAHNDAAGPKVPGVSTAIMSGVGGMMRQKMREAVAAGGTPVNINGQTAVLMPDGTTYGSVGPLGSHGLREWGVGQKIIEAPKGVNMFGLDKLFGSVGDILTGKKAQEEAAARKAAEEALQAERNRAASLYVQNIRQEGSGEGASGYGKGHSFGYSSTNEQLEDLIGDDFNMGGAVMDDDDVWGADPLATPRGTTNFGEGHRGHVQAQAPKAEMNPWLAFAQKAAMTGASNYILPGAMGGTGGFLGLNAGGWVGRRVAHLNAGGMPVDQASMQAYNEMQSMTGPEPVGAEFMMPAGSPMPEQYTPENNFGYVPSGGTTAKEQLEQDKVYIQREKAMADDDRKERAFEKQQAQADEKHQQAMQQKQESHQESMKQKRGPLATGE